MSGDKTQVEVVFWSVQQADFGMYYVMAENNIGSTEVPIVLHPAYDSAHQWQAPAGRMEQLEQMIAQSSDSKYNNYYHCTATCLACVAVSAFVIFLSFVIYTNNFNFASFGISFCIRPNKVKCWKIVSSIFAACLSLFVFSNLR